MYGLFIVTYMNMTRIQDSMVLLDEQVMLLRFPEAQLTRYHVTLHTVWSLLTRLCIL